MSCHRESESIILGVPGSASRMITFEESMQKITKDIIKCFRMLLSQYECIKVKQNFEKLVIGSLVDGLGFGNASTTLGHALSYVYSNEDISHGHALAFTTLVAHKFNNSPYYERFSKLVKHLKFEQIILKQNLDDAAELISSDRKHLDRNPKPVLNL